MFIQEVRFAFTKMIENIAEKIAYKSNQREVTPADAGLLFEISVS